MIKGALFLLFFIPNFFSLHLCSSGISSLSVCDSSSLIFPGEKHFRSMKMLTNGGENAEAYFSFDDKKLIFQSTRDGYECDQIYSMNIDGTDLTLVNNGRGRTTCAYFFPDGKQVLYASTFLSSDKCPPPPDMSKGYVWALYNYEIFSSNADGTNLKQLTDLKCYNAEATISPKGDRIVFTSTRDGDIELYSMDLDGSNVKRLTNEIGYDGGAFYSYDGSMIVYRASRPKSEGETKDFKDLLAQGLVRPSNLEIYVMKADGSNKTQVTNNGKGNFAPFFFPDGKRIIFSSNMDDPKGRNFDLYMINIDGSGLEKVTYNDTFDAFPMFSFSGEKFVFCSNRFNSKPNETNVFICDWIE